LKAKYEQMRKEEVQYEAYNCDTDYQVLIVSYGTMSRVCKTSIDMMKEQGLEVGLLRPKTLFPFPEKEIYEAATKESCKAVISIEMSMGQMVEDVERCIKGKREVDFYGECGGDIPTPEKIIEVIQGLL
ncbi:MAG: transketolase C-terminal domain-containing protein, partial [Thermodesulfobacteriota bacterium]